MDEECCQDQDCDKTTLSKEQRTELIRLLQQGAEISTEWARVLFPPEKREYELVYHGKEREEDVLANTLAVPLQLIRNFGDSVDKNTWQNMLIFGDNLQAMRSLLEQKKAGKLRNEDGTDGIRLIYIDPPFATKQDFKGAQDQKAYQDKIAGAKFIEFLRKRLILLRELLSWDGSLFFHLDVKKCHYMKVILDEVFGESFFRREIIWKCSSAHSDSDALAPIHQNIYFYSRSPKYVFNEQFQAYDEEYLQTHYKKIHPKTKRRFEDDNLTAYGLKGGGYTYEWNGVTKLWRCPPETMKKLEKENRIYYTKNGVARYVRYLDEMPGLALQDVWTDINPVNSQAVEKVDYPTQKPESLLERIIKAFSNDGDLVMDAFSGSGTTAAVAEKLSRRWVAMDCGKLSIYTIQKRLLSLKKDIGNKGEPLAAKPFGLFNAGLYDFSKLKDLPWDSWRFFALQLFQCRDQPHKIGGIQLDGYMKGASVLVFNHMKERGVRIDEETIESMHHALGSRIGSRLFIIAPALTFDFQQDYIDMEGVRYYALRIPYSIIHELHQREFTALRQPSDEMEVNDTVEAVGFDFIRTPEVALEYKVEEPKQKGAVKTAVIKLTKFQSEALASDNERAKEKFGTLSLVMLDYTYNKDSQVFNLDEIVYAEQLKATKWEIRFPYKNLRAQLMAVFTDIYGNEARVLVSKDEFDSNLPMSSPAKTATAQKPAVKSKALAPQKAVAKTKATPKTIPAKKAKAPAKRGR
jgi:DNA modification methylase